MNPYRTQEDKMMDKKHYIMVQHDSPEQGFVGTDSHEITATGGSTIEEVARAMVIFGRSPASSS